MLILHLLKSGFKECSFFIKLNSVELEYRRALYIWISLFLFSYTVIGQKNTEWPEKQQTLTAQLQFSQIKDQFNYGLVFSGPSLEMYYSNSRPLGQKTLSYEGGLGFALLFNKDAGFNARFQPLEVSILFETPYFSIGPYLATHYQWQLYPEVQSGHMFWFTSFEIGPQLTTTIPIYSRNLQFTLANSLAGLTSRPVPSTETYHYSLRFMDFIENAHSNLHLGTLNRFNHSFIKVALVNDQPLSFAYSFEYFGYYKDPKLSIINHAFHLRWKLQSSGL